MVDTHHDSQRPDAACPDLGALESFLQSRTGGESGAAPHRDAIHAHLASCCACRQRVDDMQRANDFIGRFAEVARNGDSTSMRPTDTAAGTLVSFPGYTTLEMVAVGGQGIVYRAVQAATGRVVAIKVPVGDAVRRPAKRYRFRREVELTARLRHSAIVDVLGVCETTGGRIGCVMDFVEGERFDDWATAQRAAGRSGLRRIVEAVREVADAIAHAHLNAVLHRDIKPSNVIVDTKGKPHVLDFGLAKALDGDSASFATVTGAFVGTLAFAAPEQTLDSRDATDVRTDVHGLGLLLYTALAGSPPWDVEMPTEAILHAIRETPPPHPTRTLPSSDTELDAIVLKAIAKEKSRRYQSAADFADELGRWLDGAPVRARFDSRWYVVRKTLWRRRRSVAIALAATFAVALLGSMAVQARTVRHRASIERERADSEAMRAQAIAEVMRSVTPAGDLMRGDEFARRLIGGLSTIGGRIELGAYAADPAYEAALRMTVGSLVANTPQLAGHGEVYARNALFSRIGRYGPEHPEVATGLHDLANVLFIRRRFGEALTLAERSAMIRRAHFGEAHPLTAASLELVARTRLRLGDKRGADVAIESAMRSVSEGLAAPALHAAILLTASEARDAAGDPAGAWESANGALRVALAHLPDNHPLVEGSIVEVGELTARHGRALPELADALAMGDVDGVSAALISLGDGLAGRGAAAGRRRAELLRELCAVTRTFLGDDHLAVGLTLAAVGLEDMADGEHARAVESLEAAIPILRDRLGATHLAVASCHSTLAGSLVSAGRIADAVKSTRRAIELLEAQPDGERDEQTIAVAYGYLVRYELYGRMDESALTSGRTAMALTDRVLGVEHHAHGFAACHTAWALSALGRHEEALPLVERGWRTVCDSTVAPPDQRIAAEGVLGLVLSRAGRVEAGRVHLMRMLTLLTPEFDDGRLDRFFEALVEGHRSQGDEAGLEAALTWRTRVRGTSRSASAIFANDPGGTAASR